MAQQTANRKSTEKVASSWHLAGRMEDLRSLIVAYSALSFHHVRREANRVADLMENVGVFDVRASRRGRLEDFEGEQWMSSCRQLAAHEGGDRGYITGSTSEERGWEKRPQGLPTRHLR